MSISLHAAVIPGFIQMLESLDHLVGKAEAWCAEHGKDEAAVIEAKLAPDMLDFAYQVKSASVHSIKAVEGVRAGLFTPDMNPSPRSFAEMHARIAETIAALEALDEAEIEELGERDMEFRIGDSFVVPFKGRDFLLHFSQPNLYFHVTTAYAILRHIGVAIGKRDFFGPKGPSR